MPDVTNMRFCDKCHTLFFDGDAVKGACPADGRGHRAAGFVFLLPFNVPETQHAQGAWQQCGKCEAIFFDGFPTKGTCDAGGEHERIRRHPFVIPHDVGASADTQAQWEFCTKCMVMFFDGFDDKGHCAAGGGHTRDPGAFHFVLTRERPSGFGDDNVGVPADR